LELVPTLQLNPTVVASIRQSLAQQMTPTPPLSTATSYTSTPLGGAPIPSTVSAPAVTSNIGGAPVSTTTKIDPTLVATLINRLSGLPGLSIPDSVGQVSSTVQLTQEDILRYVSRIMERFMFIHKLTNHHM
jgi:hypothetical protein